MAVTIHYPDVDLYKFVVKSRSTEGAAAIEIQKQILKFLEENNIKSKVLGNRYSSMLINKIVYFSSKKIEEKNKKMVISRGWYKYGPCFELGRLGEESFTLEILPNLESSKDIIPEIEDNCKIEIPIFLESCSSTLYSYPYHYLKHIYTKRVDIKQLQNAYYTKLEITEPLLVFKEILEEKQKKAIKLHEKAVINFNRAIFDSEYYNFIGISQNDIDLIFEYTSLMSYVLNSFVNSNELGLKGLAKDMTNNFINVVFMILANKTYQATFYSASKKYSEVIKEKTERGYNEYLKKTKMLLKEDYSKVS